MKKLNAKWYEYLFNALCIGLLLTLGVIFDTSPFVVGVNIISLIMMLFVTKGHILGSILQCFNAALYSIVSYQSMYYGEFICGVCITIPLTICGVVGWLKNRNKDSDVIKIAKISLTEIAILFMSSIPVFIGVLFLLKAFNTLNVVVSTFSLTLSIYANYLMMRRCEYSFVVYIVNNIVCIALWSLLAFNAVEYLSLAINYVMICIYNFIGLANWIKLKRKEKGDVYE